MRRYGGKPVAQLLFHPMRPIPMFTVGLHPFHDRVKGLICQQLGRRISHAPPMSAPTAPGFVRVAVAEGEVCDLGTVWKRPTD
jgi:hypothetical protein